MQRTARAKTDVLIDVTRLAARLLEGKQPTGVDRVSLAYVQHFRHRAHALVRHWGRWVELTHADSQRVFGALLGEVARPARTLRLCVGRAYVLRWGRRRGALLFNTGHSGLDQPTYATQVQRRGLRPLYFLHDLIPITHPEYCRAGEADRHQQRIKTMLDTGYGLICNSTSTQVELRSYATSLSLRTPPNAVAPLGTAALPPPHSEPPLPSPYFVVLGTVEPRKNHLLLLHLWRRMVEAGSKGVPHLVIVGQRGWECEQVVDLLERCPALHTRIIEKSRCDDQALSTWLHHARALLFPSFVEGFGMPLVEALQHGLPVIASDLPVFHEVAGEIPDYVDALDGLGWQRLVLDYTQPNSPARAAQLARMKSFSAPSWGQHFAQVDAFIETLA